MIRQLLGLFLKERIAASEGNREEIAAIMTWLERPETSLPHNGLMDAFTAFLRGEFAEVLDSLPIDYALMKREMLEERLAGHYFGSVIARYDYHRISSDLQEFMQRYHGAEPLVVQVPLEPSLDAKRAIRTQLLATYPNGFVVFRVEKPLLGGMRLFAGGKLYDKSWASEVKRLLSAT